jgi:diguanylate cyclase (GGDEF)-like protein
MYERPSSYEGPPVTCKEDERITPIGHWLRDTKINELPQLWNVLVGEMSLVGPRPEYPGIVQDWPEEARREILSVRPGITSPASILYRDEENLIEKNEVMESYLNSILPHKMRLDRLYVRNQSFFSDIDLVFWTIVIIIPRMVKVKIPEGYLFAGPFSRLVHRYISWFLIDLLTALVIVSINDLFWRSQGPLDWGIRHLAILAILLALLFSGVNAITGLNRIKWDRATVEDAFNLTLSSGAVTFTILALNYLQSKYRWLPFPSLPEAMILTIGLMAMISFVVIRYRFRLLTAVASRWLTWRKNAPGAGERVLIIGAGEGCQTANWLLRSNGFPTAFTIVGVVDDEIPAEYGMRVDGCQVLGRIADLPDLIKKYDVGMILFTSADTVPEIQQNILNLCLGSNIRLVILSSLMTLLGQQLTQPVTIHENSLWSENQIEFIAMHDVVTGLPNRCLLQDRLQHSLAYAKRYKTHLAVLIISLDGFAAINETFGPKIGNDVLKDVARRLIHCKRESDTLARFGDNEFALILENILDEMTAETIARRIFTSISAPFDTNGQEFVINTSIGICTDTEFHNDPDILNKADIGMYYDRRKKIAISN